MEAELRNTIRDALIKEFRKDPQVQAIWIGGSVGRKEADIYSDLDFYVAVPDDEFEPFFAGVPKRIDLLYPVLHCTDFASRRQSSTERVWFIYLQEFPVYFRVDFHVHTVSSAKGADPDQRRELIYREWDNLYDPQNLLAALPPVQIPEHGILRVHLQEKVDTVVWNFVLMGNYIRRERFWQAAGYLPLMRERILYLLAMDADPSNFGDTYDRRLQKSLSPVQNEHLDQLRFGSDRKSQVLVGQRLLQLYEKAARSLCSRFDLNFPEEYASRVKAMYSEMEKEDV